MAAVDESYELIRQTSREYRNSERWRRTRDETKDVGRSKERSLLSVEVEAAGQLGRGKASR